MGEANPEALEMIARVTGHEAESGMTCVDIAMTCPLNPRAVDPRSARREDDAGTGGQRGTGLCVQEPRRAR